MSAKEKGVTLAEALQPILQDAYERAAKEVGWCAHGLPNAEGWCPWCGYERDDKKRGER